jgi:hypothetical protein
VLRAPQLLALLLALAPSARAAPRVHNPHRAADSEAGSLWSFIEDNGEYIYPLVGLGVIGLIVFAVRRGMVGHEAEVQAKGRQKDAIVRMMRAKLSVTADAVAAELGVDRFRAATLLDELEREGKLVQQRVTGGVASYRLKGF